MNIVNKVEDLLTGTKDSHHTSSNSNAQALPTPPQTASTTSGGMDTSLPALPSQQVFDSSKVTVVFVLGGPGVGKGTQCESLVRDYGFKHLSAGDLLRAEQQRPDSTYGTLIKEYIREGQIVPMEVTVKLLENAMRDTLNSPPSFSSGSSLSSSWSAGNGRFLIDGFPRKMDQALKFDQSVCQSSFVLFFTATEQVMLGRLLERGKTSGRDDDNTDSIKKRFRTFEETSMPVVDMYRHQGKVVEIDSSPAVDVVYDDVRVAVDQRLGMVSNRSESAGGVGTNTATGGAPSGGASSSQVGPSSEQLLSRPAGGAAPQLGDPVL